jgi:hypothetical protein
MKKGYESVQITSPTPHQTVASTLVSVKGDCSTSGMIVDVEIMTGTVTISPVKKVTAGSPTPTWSTDAWTLSPGQNYTATAWKDGNPAITSGPDPFSTPNSAKTANG